MGMNMNKMMKQAKKLQQDMAKAQEELANKTAEGSAGGGMVTAVVNGHKEIQSLSIQPDVVDPDDIEMLEDLVIAAINDAMKKAEDMAAQDMGKFTQGFNIPGLF